LPYLTLGYYFFGAAVAFLGWYHFFNVKEILDDSDFLSIFHLVLYAFIVATMMLFIFLDWRQARKEVSLGESDQAKAGDEHDISCKAN